MLPIRSRCSYADGACAVRVSERWLVQLGRHVGPLQAGCCVAVTLQPAAPVCRCRRCRRALHPAHVHSRRARARQTPGCGAGARGGGAGAGGAERGGDSVVPVRRAAGAGPAAPSRRHRPAKRPAGRPWRCLGGRRHGGERVSELSPREESRQLEGEKNRKGREREEREREILGLGFRVRERAVLGVLSLFLSLWYYTVVYGAARRVLHSVDVSLARSPGWYTCWPGFAGLTGIARVRNCLNAVSFTQLKAREYSAHLSLPMANAVCVTICFSIAVLLVWGHLCGSTCFLDLPGDVLAAPASACVAGKVYNTPLSLSSHGVSYTFPRQEESGCPSMGYLF